MVGMLYQNQKERNSKRILAERGFSFCPQAKTYLNKNSQNQQTFPFLNNCSSNLVKQIVFKLKQFQRLLFLVTGIPYKYQNHNLQWFIGEEEKISTPKKLQKTVVIFNNNQFYLSDHCYFAQRKTEYEENKQQTQKDFKKLLNMKEEIAEDYNPTQRNKSVKGLKQQEEEKTQSIQAQEKNSFQQQNVKELKQKSQLKNARRRNKCLTNNLLATMRSVYLQFLSKKLGKQQMKNNSFLTQLKKQSWMKKKDFNQLHQRPEFKNILDQLLLTPGFLQSRLIKSKCKQQTIDIFVEKCYIFREAYQNKSFYDQIHFTKQK